MSRVFPTENEFWAVKLSIGKRIARSSAKQFPARKISIQQPKAKQHSSRKLKDGFWNFITEAKRQISLEAQNTIKRVEQWQHRTCAMFDMVQQHIVHNLQDDHHETIAEPIVVKNVKKPLKKTTVKRLGVKKPSVTPKKPPAIAKKSIIAAKKASVTPKTPSAKTSAAPKTLLKKATATATIGSANKSSTSAIKQNVKNCLPELSSDSSEESAEDMSVASGSFAFPSMPILQTEDMESDDNLNAFLKKPIELTTKVVKKRSQCDVVRTPLNDFPMRKKSMPVHSSVLAMSNKSLDTVQPMSNGEAKNAASTVVNANNVPKSFEKEPEPIPNFLKSNSPEKDDIYAKFIQLKERMKQAKNSDPKAPVLNGKNGETPGRAYPVQEQLIDL